MLSNRSSVRAPICTTRPRTLARVPKNKFLFIRSLLRLYSGYPPNT